MDQTEEATLESVLDLMVISSRAWHGISGYPQCKYQVKLP